MQRRAFVSLLGASLGAGLVSPALAAKRKTDPLAGFDAELDLARQNWRVPGLAIAVIKDGAPIYTKGFGWRDGAKTQAVTPDTLFGVASLTKAFTSATVALLVDEGKLAWDEPVTTYLPELKMAGGVEYASLSLFDMLSHRTGLGTHDLVWYNNEKLSKTELLARLPYLDTSAPLRSEYKYNNLMYILAGLVVERASGQSWEAFTEARLLKPLGMGRTGFSPSQMAHDADFAFGHKLLPSKQAVQIPLRPEDAIGPAGELHSSVTQFIPWMEMQLGRGQYRGKRLISVAQSEAMWAPLVSTGGQPEATELSRGLYGLGWRTDFYRGMRRVAHGGNLNGFSSRVTLFPEQNVGIVAFANMRGTPLPGHASLDLFDRLMGLAPANWSARGLARRDANEAKAATQTPPVPIPNTTPSRELAAFVGTYGHKGYGTWTVTLNEAGLQGTYNEMPIRLNHWHYDVFNGQPTREDDDDLLDVKFAFQADMAGKIRSLEVQMDSDFPPAVFVRTSG
ncbi:MAG: hypothetical protein RL230_1928 [Pseudomonadota bacterium]